MSSGRGLVAAATVIALGLSLSSCTGDADNPDAAPSTSTSEVTSTPAKPVTLRFGVYGEKPLIDSYQKLAAEFIRRNPAIEVEVEASPDGVFPVGGAAPDVFLSSREDLPALVSKGWVQPLDILLEERELDFGDGYQRHGLEAFSAGSALQCMPHDVSPLVVYYNERLLDLSRLVDEPGDAPPTARTGWSFEQFALATRRMSRGKGRGLHLGPDLEALAPFIWSGGGELVDDLEVPTTLTLSDDDSRAALEEVLTLVRDPDVEPVGERVSRKDAVQGFLRGELGMILGTRALTPRLREAGNLDFEVFPLPILGSFRTISSSTGYCVSSRTQHVEAAADFVAFAVGRRGATITSRSGYVVPSNVDVAQSRAFTQPGQQPRNAFVFSQTLRRADETPFVPQWPDVVSSTRPLLERLFYAPVVDLEAVLQHVDTRSQRLFVPEAAEDR